MEPRIRYAKTDDGVSIAYWTLGGGTPPLEMAPAGWSHAELDVQIPARRAHVQSLTLFTDGGHPCRLTSGPLGHE